MQSVQEQRPSLSAAEWTFDPKTAWPATDDGGHRNPEDISIVAREREFRKYKGLRTIW